MGPSPTVTNTRVSEKEHSQHCICCLLPHQRNVHTDGVSELAQQTEALVRQSGGSDINPQNPHDEGRKPTLTSSLISTCRPRFTMYVQICMHTCGLFCTSETYSRPCQSLSNPSLEIPSLHISPACVFVLSLGWSLPAAVSPPAVVSLPRKHKKTEEPL